MQLMSEKVSTLDEKLQRQFLEVRSQMKPIVCQKLKLIYFDIPKCACTSLKQWIYQIEFNKEFKRYKQDNRWIHIHNCGELNTIALHKLPEKKQDYKIITVIRDPIKRLVSAYSNRVIHHKELSESVAYRDDIEAAGLKFNPDINYFIENLESYQNCAKTILFHTRPITHFISQDLSLYTNIYPIEEINLIKKDVWLESPYLTNNDSLPEIAKLQTGGPKLKLNVLKPESFEKLVAYYAKDYGILGNYYSLKKIKEEYISSIVDRGNELREQGMLAESIENYQQAITLIKPEDPAWVCRWFYTELGGVLEKNGQVDEAISAYQKAIKITPDNSSRALAKLAKLMMRQGNIEGAVTAYQKAIAQKPKHPVWVYVGLGYALNQNGQIEEAIAAYEKAIQYNPSNKQVIANDNLYTLIGESDFKYVVSQYFPSFDNIERLDTSNNKKKYLYCLNVNYPPEQILDLDNLLNRIPAEVKSLLAEGKCYLILDASHEGHSLKEKYGQAFHKIARLLNCQRQQIIHLTQNELYLDLYNNWCQKNNLSSQNRIKILTLNMALLDMVQKNQEKYPVQNLNLINQRYREKKFLFLNNVPKPHRIFLLHQIIENNLLNDGLVSFNHKIKDDKERDYKYRPWAFKCFFPHIDLKDIDQICQQIDSQYLPLRLDLVNRDNLGPNGRGKYVREIPLELYSQTYFSIISESNMNLGHHSKRFTEKSLKPFLGLHPFLIAGQPGTLKLLRDMGFKTFSGYMDESYDLVEDPYERANLIVEQLENLCSMSQEELHNWYTELSPILFYNYGHFINRMPIWCKRDLSKKLEMISMRKDYSEEFAQESRNSKNFAESCNRLGYKGIDTDKFLTTKQIGNKFQGREKETTINAYLHSGNQLTKEGKLNQAIEKYQQALQLNPDFVPALNQLAEIYETTKEFDEAITYFRRVEVNLRKSIPKKSFLIANRLRLPYKFVFIAGMIRSGSTWSYNVTQQLSEAYLGRENVQSNWIGESGSVYNFDKFLLEKFPGSLGIVKFHGIREDSWAYTLDGSAKVIFTFRNPLESLASAKEIWNKSQNHERLMSSIEVVKRQLNSMYQWALTGKTIFINYNDLANNAHQVAESLASFLNLEVDTTEIEDIVRNNSFETVKLYTDNLEKKDFAGKPHDPKTLLHPGHNCKGASRNWKDTFDVKTQEYLLNELSDYIDSNGQFKSRWLKFTSR